MLGSVEPSYKPGVTLTHLGERGNSALPMYAITAIREALPAFERQIRGFSMADAVLTGVETRNPTTAGYKVEDILSGKYGVPGQALMLFRTYPRIPFWEQVHDNYPFYTDTGRFTPQGTYFCYKATTTYGTWSSQTANPTAAGQLGVVAQSVAITNGGTAGTIDTGDKIVVTVPSVQPVPARCGFRPGSAADGLGTPASFNARAIRATECPASRCANARSISFLAQSRSSLAGRRSRGVATLISKSKRCAAWIQLVSTLLASPLQAIRRPTMGPRCSSKVSTSAMI